MRYKAYGASRYTYGTTPTTYHFTGQREESTIGLYYYGARWYDPALGRFVQADSIVPNGAYPQDFNRYAYTRNNPVKFIDSSGHWVESAIDIVGIGLD
ncbi:MAG: RHS repeat-associated core domain-containing protein, partial [Chloroflexi bacterium]|nr:RHS repeat-associated core domain-containing protein [Chloroflexota bacterium]